MMSTQSFLERAAQHYLTHAPISLCIRELNRLLALQTILQESDGFKGPVLDVGCGDGFWWTQLERCDQPIYGVDISFPELEQAKEIFTGVEQVDISKSQPFPHLQFKEIIGNCSLEHVPDIAPALRNLQKAAAPNARLILFVPTPTWALQGRTQQLLLKKAPRTAMALAGSLNGFFQHWHLYHHRVWSSLLAQAGFTVNTVHGLGGEASEFLFRLFLPTGLFAFLFKQLAGYYPNRAFSALPPQCLKPATRLLQSSLRNPIVSPDDPCAYEYMIIATKRD